MIELVQGKKQKLKLGYCNGLLIWNQGTGLLIKVAALGHAWMILI